MAKITFTLTTSNGVTLNGVVGKETKLYVALDIKGSSAPRWIEKSLLKIEAPAKKAAPKKAVAKKVAPATKVVELEGHFI